MNDAFDVLLTLDATLDEQLVHYSENSSEPLYVLLESRGWRHGLGS